MFQQGSFLDQREKGSEEGTRGRGAVHGKREGGNLDEWIGIQKGGIQRQEEGWRGMR